jgi:hypothetical protein
MVKSRKKTSFLRSLTHFHWSRRKQRSTADHETPSASVRHIDASQLAQGRKNNVSSHCIVDSLLLPLFVHRLVVPIATSITASGKSTDDEQHRVFNEWPIDGFVTCRRPRWRVDGTINGKQTSTIGVAVVTEFIRIEIKKESTHHQ